MTEFYYLTVRNGRRFAEMYLALGDDETFRNLLRKALFVGKRGLGRKFMDRCYWENRQKHKSKH